MSYINYHFFSQLLIPFTFLCIALTVYFTQQGLIDIRGILQSTTKRELLHYFVYMMESIGREQRACNRDGSLALIADMEHMSLHQMTYLPGEIMK